MAADGDVHLGSRVLFTADGSAAKYVGTVPAPAGNPLAGLPADPWVMTMAGTLSPELGNHLIDWSMRNDGGDARRQESGSRKGQAHRPNWPRSK